MKTVLMSTSSLWNCGDEFIRNGVLNLLNLKGDVRTLWWNRAKGVRCAYENDLKLNIRHCDYFVVAGTPSWINSTEYIYRYCLKRDIPIAIIGAGTRGGIWNFRQKSLLRKLSESGLVEVCLVRDEYALETLRAYGFDNVELILDPAFFATPLAVDNKVNILGWRDYMVPEKVKLRDKAKRAFDRISGGYRELRSFAAWYDGFMQDIFGQLADPKLVVLHSNREIEKAERLFGEEHVFYATDYREIFRVYSTAKRYIGSRIHGAIPSIIHGACVDVLYLVEKARVIENSAEILSKYVSDIADSIRVFYIKDRNISFPHDFAEEQTPDRDAIYSALEQEKRKIQHTLKQAKRLSNFIK
ncbi:MAG: polysaccharide pyruvyl transferase family protein [Planctomycetota bacterium]|jgi:hypothetical protein